MSKVESINYDQEVWEGWSIQDFVDELQPSFDTIMSGNGFIPPFKNNEEIKVWCKDNQPYYKKYVKGVVDHFIKRLENLKK